MATKLKNSRSFFNRLGDYEIFAWHVREIASGLSGVFFGEIKRKRPYMSLIRYYVGKLDLAPRWDARVEDVLSAAMSVAKIDSAQNSRGRNYFYVVFSASDFRHVLDVMRVFRANGIVGTLCYKDVVNSAGKPQKMLALRVRDRGPKYFIRLVCEKPGDTQGNLLMFQLPVYDGGQKFIRDVQNTIGDVTYYRNTVLPEYTEAHKNKRYIFQELFGKFR